MSRFRFRFLALLFLAGLLLSGYSAYEHLAFVYAGKEGGALCNIGAGLNCKAAIQSSYSELFGVPLGGFGVAFYLACLFPFVLWRREPQELPSNLIQGLAFLALLSALASVFLLVVSLTQLSALCPVCLAMYLVSFLVLILLALHFGGLVKFLAAAFSFPIALLKGESGPEALRNGKLLLIWITIALFISLGFLTLRNQFERRKTFEAGSETGKAKFVAAYLKRPLQEIPLPGSEDSFQVYTLGPEDAPIRLVEFFDYECPFCREFTWTLQELLEQYPNELRVEIRNYPLDHNCNPGITEPFHEAACLAAEFVRCAGEQGRFIDAHRYVMGLAAFEETDSRSQLAAAITGGTERLDFDAAAMEECLESNRQIPAIQKDIEIADSLGIPGTPSVWINGRAAPSLRIEGLRAVIEYLKRSPKP